jgi:hypothetical protein
MINEAKASQAFLTLEAYKAMEKVAQGQATNIIIPSDMQGIVGLASSLVDVVKK